MMFKLTSVAACLLVLAVGLAGRAHATAPAPDYGVVTTNANVVGRVIDIKPETRYLNVRNGEVVTIHMGDSSFTWEVSTATNVTAIPLEKIAPAGAPSTVTWVYISASDRAAQDRRKANQLEFKIPAAFPTAGLAAVHSAPYGRVHHTFV